MDVRRLHLWLAIALVILLTACGGGPQAPDNLFNKKNAWTTPVPADATMVSSDEFKRMVDSGELALWSTADIKAQAAARDQQFRDDKAFLSSIPNSGPYIKELLAKVKNYDSYQGDVPLKLPDGDTVVLNGLGAQLRTVVQSYKLSQSADNALTFYTQLYELLPDDLKAKSPTPDSLKGKSLADIQAALKQLNDLLAGVSNLDRVRLEPTPIAPASGLSPQKTPLPGQGKDNNGPCKAPTGLVAQFWFPLKNFVSPIKNQGARGTCWDFTAIGTVESRELVQDGKSVNLSEQFLNNKVKRDWAPHAPVNYGEGASAGWALNEAVAHGQALPNESFWTYNPASGLRPPPKTKDTDPSYYTGTCDQYTGSCSPTAHESSQFCTMKQGRAYCGYDEMTFSGPGIKASPAYGLWVNPAYEKPGTKTIDTWNLYEYRYLLSHGHEIIASFRVYPGFDHAVNGYVSDYTATTYRGGHVVQIVGFISNKDLQYKSGGGGGYFIIKNSWGCGAGDGGYYYVPADYVHQLFGSLATLEFGPKRSEAWTHAQQYPGPDIVVVPKPATVDLRVPTDLTRFFKVYPLAHQETLTVTSNLDGTIYSGPWNVAPKGGIVINSLNYTFTTQGVRTLSLTASYGGNQSSASFQVNVVNSPPTLTLEASGTAYQGTPYPITAQEYDKNEAKSSTLCANTTWSVDAPDTLSKTTGCQVEVTFAETGSRTVHATTHDTEGLTGADTLTVDVQPPPQNPYPKITSAGVYSWMWKQTQSGLVCEPVNVPSGSTIDFGAWFCTAGSKEYYFAQVKVDDPSSETLTYDWKVYVTINGSESVLEQSLGSSSSTFVPYNVYASVPVTNACRIMVKVNAPDPSRSKSQTVWTGTCTYNSVTIH